MKLISIVALFSLIQTSSFSCETYEAQIIASIDRVETVSKTSCKAFLDASSIDLYNEHALCPLELSEVLENGINFDLAHGLDCYDKEIISGYLFTTKTGISLD